MKRRSTAHSLPPAGLEPATFGLKGRRSNQLSYGSHLFPMRGIEPRPLG